MLNLIEHNGSMIFVIYIFLMLKEEEVIISSNFLIHHWKNKNRNDYCINIYSFITNFTTVLENYFNTSF
jgi:hypothetical protein